MTCCSAEPELVPNHRADGEGLLSVYYMPDIFERTSPALPPEASQQAHETSTVVILIYR